MPSSQLQHAAEHRTSAGGGGHAKAKGTVAQQRTRAHFPEYGCAQGAPAACKSVTLRSKKQQIRNKIVIGGTGKCPMALVAAGAAAAAAAAAAAGCWVLLLRADSEWLVVPMPAPPIRQYAILRGLPRGKGGLRRKNTAKKQKGRPRQESTTSSKTRRAIRKTKAASEQRSGPSTHGTTALAADQINSWVLPWFRSELGCGLFFCPLRVTFV
jgi:hypothetical protein